jgi:hypothetical protein
MSSARLVRHSEAERWSHPFHAYGQDPGRHGPGCRFWEVDRGALPINTNYRGTSQRLTSRRRRHKSWFALRLPTPIEEG